MDATLQLITFYFFAAIAIVSGFCVVSLRNPVSSAMSLVLAFVAVAGLYLTLNATFVAAVQILVYAGAIMVLFLFVIMLLNLEIEPREEPGVSRLIGAALTAALLFALVAFFFAGRHDPVAGTSLRSGDAYDIGRLFASEYAFPFEAASILLLVAMVGAIVLGRRRRASEDES
jgi:NADH-quinone oxidoreductase subunit J